MTVEIKKWPLAGRIAIAAVLWVDFALDFYMVITKSSHWYDILITVVGFAIAALFSHYYVPPLLSLGKYNFHRIPKGQRIKISCKEYRKKVTPR